MRTYLTDAEVADKCRPLKQPAAQMRHLQRLGYQVDRRPDGTVLAWLEQNAPAGPAANGPKWKKRA
jgi:hypothetical protein